MDVLNTYGGGVHYDYFAIFFGVIVALIFGCCTVVAWRSRDTSWTIAFLVLAVVGVLGVVINVAYPDQTTRVHEVTLRPDGVIDARKYEIIEQRGAIYVIEEREAAQ